MSRQIVGRKATYLYLDNIITMAVGYALWFILSKIAAVDVIGVSSTVISLTLIFTTIVDLGVSQGSTRFMARSFSERQIGNAKTLVTASLLLIGIAILACSGAILVFKDWIFPSTIGSELIILSIFLLTASAVYAILRSVLIASLETQSLPKITVISSACKISVTIGLVLLGVGATGITLGYMSAFASSAILSSYTLLRIFKPYQKDSTIDLYQACKTILLASIPSWAPKVLSVIGARIGTVFVFAIEGANQAGSYFIASSVFYAITAMMDSLFSIAFPVLSSMDDQRKRYVWRLIKISLVITLPLSSTAILYSEEILGIFGQGYVGMSVPLKIILLSTLAIIFNVGITTLVYSYGNYWYVLFIGIGSSAPRILLYFILIPLYGSTGAAISFTIGSFVSFVVAAIAARQIRMLIYWRQIALLFSIPTATAFVLDYLHVNYFTGIPVIFFLAFILFVALRLLTKSDICDSLGILPDRIGKPIINIVEKFSRK